jgi:hypothetical protein
MEIEKSKDLRIEFEGARGFSIALCAISAVFTLPTEPKQICNQ